MDSAGKRKQTKENTEERAAKKPRRKSCLAKRNSGGNIQRDPTEPVMKRRTRVSFAPPQVKEFNSYNSSGNSTISLETTKCSSFSEAEKENKSGNVSSLSSVPPPSLNLNSTVGFLDQFDQSFDLSGGGGSFNTNVLLPPKTPDIIPVNKTPPRKRRSLLEKMQSKNIFRQMMAGSLDKSLEPSSFQDDINNLFQASPPVQPPEKFVFPETLEPEPDEPAVIDDDTLDLFSPNLVTPTGPGNDTLDFLNSPDVKPDATVRIDQTITMEKTINLDKNPKINQTVNMDRTAALDRTVAAEQTIAFETTMNQTGPVDQTVAMEQTMTMEPEMQSRNINRTEMMEMAPTMHLEQSMEINKTAPREIIPDSTLDFEMMEKSIHNSRPNTPLAPLTPLQKLQRRLLEPSSMVLPEVDDLIPNFTPPTLKGINLDRMRAELHEEKAPGTPEISMSKPRHKLMRARDSIGVAKFHLEKKFTRDTTLDQQSPSRSVRVTRDVPTPTGTPSGRITRSHSRSINQSPAVSSSISTRSSKLPTPSLTPRPRAVSHKSPDPPKESSSELNFSELGNSFLGQESYLTMDQTEAIQRKTETANIFKNNRIFDDSMSDSLQRKTFNFTMKEKSILQEKEIPENLPVVNEELINQLEEVKKEVEVMAANPFENMGEEVQENAQNEAKRFEYYQAVKPSLQYDEYTVKRLAKQLTRGTIPPEQLNELENTTFENVRFTPEIRAAYELAAEKKYLNIVAQVLDNSTPTTEDAANFLKSVLVDIEKHNVRREEDRRACQENLAQIENAENLIKRAQEQSGEYRDLVDSAKEIRQKIEEADKQLAEIAKQVSELELAEEIVTPEIELKSLAAELDCIPVGPNLYFLNGAIFYDCGQKRFLVNSRCRPLEPELIMFRAGPDTKEMRPKFLSRLVSQLNETGDFPDKLEQLKSADQTFKRFAKQIVFAKTRTGNGFYVQDEETGCIVGCMAQLTSGMPIEINWKVDVEWSSYQVTGVDVKNYFPDLDISENDVKNITKVLGDHQDYDDVSYFYDCTKAVEEMTELDIY